MVNNCIFNNNDTVYIELKFAPNGSTLTETFSRMAVRASAYAIRAGRADIANEADSAFQFDSATDGSGYTPSAGMVYYDSDENSLKLYNGSAWVDVAAGARPPESAASRPPLLDAAVRRRPRR